MRNVTHNMALQSEKEQVAHLLRRFAFGASEAELDFYAEGGYKAAVDRLLNFEEIEEVAQPAHTHFLQGDPPRLQIQGVMSWWGTQMLVTRRPLLQKLTLFWHDHFATSAAKVTVPPMMFQHVETLQRYAAGKFEDLLLEVSKDPAMIFWLDNQFNVKGKPNENFAREIMELFTLGIGHYTEDDVQEAARAFTGWNLRRNAGRNADPADRRFAEFQFRPLQHDAGAKTVLGNKGEFSGVDVVKLLAGHPQTARYIALKMWEWFAYPKPEPKVLERVSDKFQRSGLDVKVLVREIMLSPEFLSPKAIRGVYKNPVDFVVPTLRQLGIGEALAKAIPAEGAVPRLALGPVAAMLQTTRSMGMQLLFPPDVAGWEGGSSWISSATMVERIGWADKLFGVATAPGRLQVRFAAMPLFSADPTPKGVVDRLVSLFDAPIAASKLPALVSAAEKASGGTVRPANANATAAAVSKLIFGSPEFQFA